MISKFFTIPHTVDTLKTLELRAVHLVTNFLNDSTDEDLKSRIYERYLGQADDSLSLTVGKADLNKILKHLQTSQQITESAFEAFLCVSSDQNRMIRWQSLILIVSMEHRRLFKSSEDEAKISADRTKSALNAFRLILQDKEKGKNLEEIAIIENKITDALQHLKPIVPQLHDFFKHQPKPLKKYIQRRLRPIHLVLADVAGGKLNNVRDRGERGSTAGENQQEAGQNTEDADANSSPVKRGSYTTRVC